MKLKSLIIILTALVLVSCSKDKKNNCEECTYLVLIEGISDKPIEVEYDFLNLIIPAEYDKCMFLDTADSKNIPWLIDKICE